MPRFDEINDDAFAVAFDTAIVVHEAEIDAIANNADEPTVANTIVALELAGNALGRISALFWHRSGANTNEIIQTLERDIAPKLSRHYSKIGINSKLFGRLDTLWETRDSLDLTPEEVRVLERHWKGFVKSGAKLPPPEQARLVAIKERLSSLTTAFGQNVLTDEKTWVLFLSEEADLAGLPAFLKEAMAVAAADRGKPGAYAVTPVPLDRRTVPHLFRAARSARTGIQGLDCAWCKLRRIRQSWCHPRDVGTT